LKLKGLAKQIAGVLRLPMIQIHSPPTHAGGGIFGALFGSGAESIVGSAEVAGAPEAFGLDRGIGGARQALIACASARVTMMTESLARKNGRWSGWGLGREGKCDEKPNEGRK